MTKILHARLTAGERAASTFSFRVTADVQFTGSDLSRGQSGASTFKVSVQIWDEDTFSDDRVVRHWVAIPRANVSANTHIDENFKVSWSDLKSKEPFYEGAIELYGGLHLFRDDKDIDVTAQSNVVSVDFPKNPTTSGQHIEVSTEGSGQGTSCVVKGSKFTPGALVVLRFTDPTLHQVQGHVTVTSSGTFTSRTSVPCRSGIGITVTAFEDANPSGTNSNAVQLSCP